MHYIVLQYLEVRSGGSGRSMGAVTAILRAAEDSGICALVLDSPFSALAREVMQATLALCAGGRGKIGIEIPTPDEGLWQSLACYVPFRNPLNNSLKQLSPNLAGNLELVAQELVQSLSGL